ncbi:hypothetical protein E4T44_05232 [Aureobasidium sp. EXF-8845]|nr:hypothetical protein E4T44_05232 [Aureobasidium sp. EXF-8845]
MNKRHKYSLFDLDDDVAEFLDDEYQWWCQRPRDRFALGVPPLEFWTSYAFKKTFARLQKMALDVFTIPAMSDEPERVLSSTGLMVRPHQSRLSQRVIAMSQCLRNWSRQNLVTFQIFETMKERLQHVEAITESCIYFVIVACGSVASARLAKNYGCFSTPPSFVKEQRNLRQYCKATVALQKYIDLASCGKRTIEPVPLYWLLFVAYESYQDETALATQRLKFDRRAIGECATRGSEFSSKGVAKNVAAAFDWMGSQVLEYGEEELQSKEQRRIPTQPFFDIRCSGIIGRRTRRDPQRLDSTSGGAGSLFTSVVRALITPATNPACPSASSLVTTTSSAVKNAGSHSSPSTASSAGPTFLLILQRHARGTCGSIRRSSSTVLDLIEEFVSNNERVDPYTTLPQKQESCFSLEYAVVLTLHAICFKVHHSKIRKRALQLLQSANRREIGQWSGELCHHVDAIITLGKSVAGPADLRVQCHWKLSS